MNCPNDIAWRPDFDTSPLFNGLHAWTAELSRQAQWPSLETLNRLAAQSDVRNARNTAIRFQEQSEKCSQLEYEHGIYRSGNVPTRVQSWHDLFNALIWIACPRTKAALNAAHHAELPDSTHAGRGPVSDAATLFDESGLVLVAQDTILVDLLRAKDWKAAFWKARPRWQHARLYVVGHSLLEKSLAPQPGMTGKCLFIHSDEVPALNAPLPGGLDERIAAIWQRQEITRPADLFPLPLMGIPGYAANDFAAFYDNTSVFRPPRSQAIQGPDRDHQRLAPHRR